jgi:N-acyl-D-aspartate/D-glutamate deacylase
MKYFTVIALLLLSCSGPRYDILIKGASVYDGSGSPPTVTDVAINADTIAAIGNLASANAGRTIEASGLALSPGFIDLHAHIEPLLGLPAAESHVRQGVTTALGGPDGSSPWPFGKYLDSAARAGIGINVAYLVGHNTIRRQVMGLENRDPAPDELSRMKDYVALGMQEGAFGLSTGLKYLPGTFSKTAEVIELSKAAAQQGGFYTSHLREEGLGLLEGVAEAITISREAGIPVVLTHHKAIGVSMWGASVKTLAMVDSARKLGLDIMIDQYPYTASHTGLAVLIPPWALEGHPVKEFTKRTDNPALRKKIKEGVVFNILYDRGGKDLNRIQFSQVSWDSTLEGKTLRDWLVREGVEPTVENGADFVIEAQRRGGAGAIFHAMDEGDVQRILKHPMTMVASDGGLQKFGEGHPHPRAYGTFPRVLGRYVRELKVLSMEEALHKMTGMPAGRMGLSDRGYIRKGHCADLVVFDPATIDEKGTFEDPHQYPVGIHFVIINGTVAVEEGRFTGSARGRVLRGRAYTRD